MSSATPRRSNIYINSQNLTVPTSILAGDPKVVLLEAAAEWSADCIFLGSRGLNRWERLLLGSVSHAVATRARCPVEVIRMRQTDK